MVVRVEKLKKNEINCNLLKTNLSCLAQDVVCPIVGGGSLVGVELDWSLWEVLYLKQILVILSKR